MPSARAVSLAALVAAVAVACTIHIEPPPRLPTDATGGHVPPGFDDKHACADWYDAAGPGAASATSHVSFPELDPVTSCFIVVRYDAAGPKADPIPAGCGYPRPLRTDATIDAITRRAAQYEKIADGVSSSHDALPLELACSLPDEIRRAAARTNARTTRALATRLAAHAAAPFPYTTVATFGYGFSAQSKSVLVSFRPGEACPALSNDEMGVFDSNYVRATRAAAAWRAGIAPVISVSGGAIHSRLTEAFLLDYLLTCRFGIPGDAVLVDPCANHTHTNVRNSGSLVVALGGRTAYLVTDDGLQARYLDDYTTFDFLFGSIDERALRDFGYLLGAHRLASVGHRGGYWYTPYRFWAEPTEGLGSFTCIP